MYKDLFGQALLDFYQGSASEDLVTWTSISDEDILPLDYLFRDYEEMPKIEKEALKRSNGTVLDIGCGAGSHALWLQNQGLEVLGVDYSQGAIEVAQKRGVKNVIHSNFLDLNGQFDTILMLMNGTGLLEELSKLTERLNHLKSLMSTDGQILIDSSDLIYMYPEDDLAQLKSSGQYYGELDYFLSYKDSIETPLKWLYLDFNTLKLACDKCDLMCIKLMNGDHFDYLAKITHR